MNSETIDYQLPELTRVREGLAVKIAHLKPAKRTRNAALEAQSPLVGELIDPKQGQAPKRRRVDQANEVIYLAYHGRFEPANKRLCEGERPCRVCCET